MNLDVWNLNGVNQWYNVFAFQCGDIKRIIEIKNSFLNQEKVYICRRNNFEYVKY